MGADDARAATLTDEQVHRSDDDEWSFVDTLPHLVFAMDSWFGNAILGQEQVIVNEDWAHHRFATRDLDVIEG